MPKQGVADRLSPSIGDLFATQQLYCHSTAECYRSRYEPLRLPSYFVGREPVMRISTSLLALCCQSGLLATLDTPISARSRSNGSRSLRMSPLLIARFTSESIAPWIRLREPSYSFEGPPTSVFSAGAIMCFV